MTLPIKTWHVGVYEDSIDLDGKWCRVEDVKTLLKDIISEAIILEFSSDDPSSVKRISAKLIEMCSQ